MRSIIALGAMNLGVHYFTYAFWFKSRDVNAYERRIYHPFLLADNRHYVFYLLRRVFLPFPTAKYLVTPIYLFSLRAWMWRLRES